MREPSASAQKVKFEKERRRRREDWQVGVGQHKLTDHLTRMLEFTWEHAKKTYKVLCVILGLNLHLCTHEVNAIFNKQ